MTVDIRLNPIILLIRRKHLYKLPIYNKFKMLLKKLKTLKVTVMLGPDDNVKRGYIDVDDG